jgi:hypothetical protein
MEAKFKVLNPDAIEMELTVKMPLRDWKRLQEQLPNKYPAYRLIEQIADMTRQAEKHFTTQDKEE